MSATICKNIRRDSASTTRMHRRTSTVPGSTHVKEVRSVINLFVANGTRYANASESFNCLLILNPEWKPDDPESKRVVLSNTVKVEKYDTYRMNVDFYCP